MAKPRAAYSYATDTQKKRAHAALSQMLGQGMTVHGIAQRIGIDPSSIRRFSKTRSHMGRERCLAVIALAQANAPHAPIPTPVAPARPALPGFAVEPCAPTHPVAAAPAAQQGITLTTAQWDELDALVSAHRQALPGVTVSRVDVARGLLAAALKASVEVKVLLPQNLLAFVDAELRGCWEDGQCETSLTRSDIIAGFVEAGLERAEEAARKRAKAVA